MLDTPDAERATRSLASHSAPDPSVETGSEAAAGRSAPARILAALHSRTVARVAAADVAELPGYRGDLLRGLEVAAKWLWRDGRPRAVVGQSRSIQWCNPAARRLLVEPAPLVIKRNQLCPAKGVDIDAVDAFLARIGPETSRLQVMDAITERGVLLTAWTEMIDGIQASFIEFGLRELPFDAQQSGMAAYFGLTRAECVVVDAMVEMEPPAQIAARLGVSVNTIRTHIRRIYGKLAVRSQLQFMRLTMAYCGG